MFSWTFLNILILLIGLKPALYMMDEYDFERITAENAKKMEQLTQMMKDLDKARER